jgi:1,4-alpha-glucan branching enzyme/maltooligosyltrehalose trehalohydrolase
MLTQDMPDKALSDIPSTTYGATLLAPDLTSFRLWAPNAGRVDVVLNHGERSVAMQALSDGWFEAIAECGAGTRYMFCLDGDLQVPDPASRAQESDAHGPSIVMDPGSYQWRDRDWRGRRWEQTVLYELHVGACGGFAGVTDMLPALARLGITAVELMPIAAFPGSRNWGYDGVLQYAPETTYGTPDQLKALVDTAHALGVQVFLDVVYNHFGPDGNYLNAYAPDFFSATHDSPWGAAINFDGPGSRTVRDFFIHNALYWATEYRIDGLRLDAVHAIVDGSEPDLLEELSRRVREAAGQRHVHLVTENENNAHRRLAPRPEPGRYDGQWNDDFHHALYVTLTGDSSGYYHDYGRQAVDLLARSFTHGMLFEGSHRKPGGAREQCIAAPPQHLPAMVNAAHNHDQVGNRAFGERLTQLVPPAAAQLATLLALLTPATPLLFFGEESGSETPFLYFADWDGELRDAVRAGRQREFGHAAAAGRELPDPCSAATFCASHPDDARRDNAYGQRWVRMVKEALDARRSAIVPRQDLLLAGQHSAMRVGRTGMRVRWHSGDGAVLALDLNIGGEAIEVAPEPGDTGEALFQHNRPDRSPNTRLWPAWSALWWLGNNGATAA